MKRSTLRLMRSSRLSSGLAAQAGRDDDDVAGGDVAHVAGVDALVGDEAGAVQQVERLPLGQSALASIRQMLLTTPPHCRANAVELPTKPPPPMMLTFMGASNSFKIQSKLNASGNH